MINIEHPAYSLIKAVGLHLGFSPEEGESWASVVGDPYQVWGPIQSASQAHELEKLLYDLGVGINFTLRDDLNLCLTTIAVIMTQHSLRVAEFRESESGKKD